MVFPLETYTRALEMAARAHAGQCIPGSDLPYLLHVVKVAAETWAAVMNRPDLDPELALAAALLHDTIEDTRVTSAIITQHFGAAVAGGVGALTKDKNLPKEARMKDSLRRIREQPVEIWMVKLCDRIVNLGPPPERWTSEKRGAYLAEAGEILTALGEADPNLKERFVLKMREYEKWITTGARSEPRFVKIEGFTGKIYSPEIAPSRKKHNCPDCYSCQMCSDERCALCLGLKKKNT